MIDRRRSGATETVWCTLLSGVLLAMFAASLPQEAFAHATLIHSSPAPSSRLEHPPTRIELTFNERIEAVFHSLRIVDAQGREMQAEVVHPAGGGETLVAILGAMPPGAYAVYWRINSLDGHQLQGHFGFGVASDPPTELQIVAWMPKGGPALSSWLLPLLKGLSLLCLSVWFGVFGMLALGHSASGIITRSDLHHKFLDTSLLIALAAGGAYLLLELLALVAKAAAFGGTSFWSAVSVTSLQATLVGSSYGKWWAIRFGASVLLLLLSVSVLRRRFALLGMQTIGWLLAAIVITSIAATGHAQAAAGNLMLSAAIHAVHLAASIVWVGGLFYLAIAAGTATASLGSETIPHDEGAIEWISGLASRFSRLAQVSLLLIFATGVYNAWLHIPSWNALVATAYGRTLLGKLLWVFLTLAVAFINWRKVLPELGALRRGIGARLRWVPYFQSLLHAEFAGCMIVFATVAMLVNLPPATADPQAGPRELRQMAGEREVLLRIDPARLGANNLHLAFLDSSGNPQRDVRKVTIYLRSLEMDMGLNTGEALLQPDGTFEAQMIFTMSGRWRVSVEVQPGQGDAFVVEYDVSIS